MKDSRRNIGITAAVLQQLTKNPGVVIYLNDIAKETGYPEAACQANIGNAIAAKKVEGVEVVIRGRAWRYVPNKKPDAPATAAPAKRMFQEIGVTKDGSIVVECEDGKLYKAEEL